MLQVKVNFSLDNYTLNQNNIVNSIVLQTPGLKSDYRPNEPKQSSGFDSYLWDFIQAGPCSLCEQDGKLLHPSHRTAVQE